MKKSFLIISILILFFLLIGMLDLTAIVKDDNSNKNLSPAQKDYGRVLNKDFLKDRDFSLTPGAYMTNKKYEVPSKEKLKWAFIMSEQNPFL